MLLTTPVHIVPSDRKITYRDRLLFLGSCFADSISACMSEYYFRLTANPFGTLYNPLSIAQAIRLQELPEPVEWGGLYHSMMHHGRFSTPSPDLTRSNCEESIRLMQKALEESTIVCVTFGTAWVYELGGQVVANCHKMPAERFRRRRLTADEIVDAWKPILEAYPDKHFIFTVSPVRHLKDGLHENQLSKSILLQAVDSLCSISEAVYTPLAKRSYFPAFEIMLDELRDYRFYADDMLHPSAQAVQYIFSRFADCYIDEATRADMQQLHRLYLDRQHRFLHPDSPEAAAFLARLEQQTASLRTRFPWI